MLSEVMPEAELKVTEEDIKNVPKDWQETYMEERKPVWEQTLEIDGHQLVIINYDTNFTFSEKHHQELKKIIIAFRQLNPNLITKFKKIVISDLSLPVDTKMRRDSLLTEQYLLQGMGYGCINGDRVLIYPIVFVGFLIFKVQ